MEHTAATTLTCEIAEPVVAPRTGAALDKPIHVLLVEDHREAAEQTQIRLTQEGEYRFRVEWTSTLLEAMQRLGKPGIDVVLLDLGMPELTGYKTFRAIEAATEDKLPIVVFTSDESRVSKDLTLEGGAAGYLLKHKSSPAQLRQALGKAVIGNKASTPPARRSSLLSRIFRLR
jgi:CheY-like chemotaxis protein